MAVTRLSHITTLRGQGTVYRDETPQGRVNYILEIYQQMLDGGGYGEIEGMKEVVGQIRTSADFTGPLVHQEGLVLHLENGGKMPFIVSDVNQEGFEIKPSDEITGVPELLD